MQFDSKGKWETTKVILKNVLVNESLNPCVKAHPSRACTDYWMEQVSWKWTLEEKSPSYSGLLCVDGHVHEQQDQDQNEILDAVSLNASRVRTLLVFQEFCWKITQILKNYFSRTRSTHVISLIFGKRYMCLKESMAMRGRSDWLFPRWWRGWANLTPSASKKLMEELSV